MSESINCDNYNDYFTPAVLAAVRPYAKKLANRTDGGLSADDLIQTAIMMLIRRKRATVQDMAKLLTRNILYAYVIWVRGSETGRQGTQQDRYMAGVPIEPHSTIKELTIADPSKDWMLPAFVPGHVQCVLQRLGVRFGGCAQFRPHHCPCINRIPHRLNGCSRSFPALPYGHAQLRPTPCYTRW